MSGEGQGTEPRVGALRRALSRRLSQHLPVGQRESAELDARLLMAASLGIAAADLLRIDQQPADEATVGRLEALALRRLAGEPVARILGEKEFWSLPLRLSPDTLVPRPDTEILVEAALEGARGTGPLRILDIGTGSGAILLALLHELPGAFGVGTDRSLGALKAASANAEALGLRDRATFLQTNWADALNGPFHVIASNPPYVATREIGDLQSEVRMHDPVLALDGGADGLDAYRAILPELPRLLDANGRAFLEVGMGQADAVWELSERLSFSCFIHRDLAGHRRTVELQLQK